MKILISNTSTRPLYEQIKDQLKDAFAADLKVSVLTIRRVYDDLEQEGFVTSQVGKGTFVSQGNVELLRDARRRRVEEKMAAMIADAKTLGITKEELSAMMDILYEEDE